MDNTSIKSGNRIPLFCFVTALFWFSMYTYVPILTTYVEHLGASHETAGIIIGSYGFMQMIMRIPMGWLSDKINKRRLFISIGLSFAFFSGLGLFAFQNLSLILIFRALSGIAAATWVDFTILFSSYYKHDDATKAMGTINFYNSVGTMIAMYVGGLVAEQNGPGMSFLLGATAAAIGIFLSFFLSEHRDKNAQGLNAKDFVYVISDKMLITVSALAILSQLIVFATIFGFTPVFAQSHLNASESQLGYLTFAYTLPNAVSSLLAGKYLSQKYGERILIVAGFILMGIFTLLVPLTKNISALIFTQALMGFGNGLAFPMLMGLSIKYVPSEKRSTAMGIFQSIYGLGMFLGPVIMGVISDMSGLNISFVIMGSIGLITAVISMYVIKTEKSFN